MDLRDQLQTALGDRYSIERELGGGGMSRVFVAEETQLRRRVVFKVLSPELAAGISAERFEREIRLAATLQQANIVPLMTAGETQGLPYYTMPFIDGLSLRARLASKGALGIAETVGILRDVARALAYAHERGVVHRDIKPENILLSGDAAVVTDFGIAKALAAAKRGEGPEGDHPSDPPIPTLTQLGTSLGTPAYMAPEQAAGDPATDHRADIYSLGCVAYEMLRGEAPFAGRPMHQLFAAHLNEMPEPIERSRRDVPRALAALIARCMEKDPQRRPQSAREILQALDTVSSGQGASSSPMATRRRALILVAAGVGLIAAVALIAALRHRAEADTAAGSVAVLPFDNASGDTSSNYFADGMTDELATALAKVPGLRVASHTSSYMFRKHEGLDVRAIANKLGVSAIVEGSVRRAGNQVRVTAQLSRGSDGTSMWADAFTGDASDVFGVQARLTQAIVTAVTPSLAGEAPKPATIAKVAVPGTKDATAYDKYLRARYELNRRGAGVRTAIALFHESLARDPKFVSAWSGLSAAWAALPDYDDTEDAASAADSARAAATRATALDSLAAEAWGALGYAVAGAGSFDEGATFLRRAVRLDPSNDVWHRWLGLVYRRLGKYDESLAEMQIAVALDPLSPISLGNLSTMLALYPRLRDSARAIARRAIALDPLNTGGVANASRTLFITGDYQESLTAIQTVMASTRSPQGGIGWPTAGDYAALGQRDSLAVLIPRVERLPRTVQDLETIAMASAAARHWDRAFAAADSAVARGTPTVWIDLFGSLFKPVVGDPRLLNLCRRAQRDCGPVIRIIQESLPLPGVQ